jgi:hypothetical protein
MVVVSPDGQKKLACPRRKRGLFRLRRKFHTVFGNYWDGGGWQRHVDEIHFLIRRGRQMNSTPVFALKKHRLVNGDTSSRLRAADSVTTYPTR